jgi:hypothetical protein
MSAPDECTDGVYTGSQESRTKLCTHQTNRRAAVHNNHAALLCAERMSSEQKAGKKTNRQQLTISYIMRGRRHPWAQVAPVLHRSREAGRQAHQAGASS